MKFLQPGLWKIDAMFLAAAALAVALTSTIAACAHGTEAVAPASAASATTLTAVSPAAGAKAPAPALDPSTVGESNPHRTLGLTEPDRESLDGEGSENASQHPGAQ